MVVVRGLPQGMIQQCLAALQLPLHAFLGEGCGPEAAAPLTQALPGLLLPGMRHGCMHAAVWVGAHFFVHARADGVRLVR